MQKINQDIKSASFRQMYLLYGEERYLKNQYTERLRKALAAENDTMNVSFFDGKNVPVEQVIDLAETLPFFAERRVIFVRDSGLFKSGGEKLAEYLKACNPTTFFVFTESEVDKRSKLYKAVQAGGYVSEFTEQDEATLKRWIGGILAKEGKKISENTAALFLSKTGTDMQNIQMELEKLISYCMDRDIITSEDVEAITTTRITNHIFDMVAAIAEKNPKRALELYYDLLALKEPPMRILFLIARQCNLLLRAKEMKAAGHGNGDIAKALGVPPFAVGKYLAQASHFKKSVLLSAVEQCVQAEEDVKSGRMSDVMSVELLILSVLPA